MFDLESSKVKVKDAKMLKSFVRPYLL